MSKVSSKDVDLMPDRQQALDKGRPQEATGSCDGDPHGGGSVPRFSPMSRDRAVKKFFRSASSSRPE